MVRSVVHKAQRDEKLVVEQRDTFSCGFLAFGNESSSSLFWGSDAC